MSWVRIPPTPLVRLAGVVAQSGRAVFRQFLSSLILLTQSDPFTPNQETAANAEGTTLNLTVAGSNPVGAASLVRTVP